MYSMNVFFHKTCLILHHLLGSLFQTTSRDSVARKKFRLWRLGSAKNGPPKCRAGFSRGVLPGFSIYPEPRLSRAKQSLEIEQAKSIRKKRKETRVVGNNFKGRIAWVCVLSFRSFCDFVDVCFCFSTAGFGGICKTMRKLFKLPSAFNSHEIKFRQTLKGNFPHTPFESVDPLGGCLSGVLGGWVTSFGMSMISRGCRW